MTEDTGKGEVPENRTQSRPDSLSSDRRLRVLVCGGRDYRDAENVYARLSVLNPDVVIHGGASGADSLAGQWAEANGRACRVVFPDWSLGPKAGPLRNQKMLDEHAPDVVLAFPGGRGTADMVRWAKAANVPVIEVYP